MKSFAVAITIFLEFLLTTFGIYFLLDKFGSQFFQELPNWIKLSLTASIGGFIIYFMVKSLSNETKYVNFKKQKRF